MKKVFKAPHLWVFFTDMIGFFDGAVDPRFGEVNNTKFKDNEKSCLDVPGS